MKDYMIGNHILKIGYTQFSREWRLIAGWPQAQSWSVYYKVMETFKIHHGMILEPHTFVHA